MARPTPLTGCFRSAGRPGARARGFSLVELIVVIVITGIIASVVGIFIAGPIQGFFDQARRAELVDAAQLALTRLARDLRAALPNSVRINGAGNGLELLLTLDGDRYRAEAPGTDDDRLDFAAPGGDQRFNTFAPLYPPSPFASPYDVTGAIAIYPLQQTGANVYAAADGLMTAFGTIRVTQVAVNGNAEYQVALPAAHRFPYESPTRRVFLVQGPVTYRCAGGVLVRYSGYGVAAAQPDPPIGPPLVTTTVARNVEACVFRYAPGTAERNAVVSAAISLLEAGERVRLVRQVHLDNSP